MAVSDVVNKLIRTVALVSAVATFGCGDSYNDRIANQALSIAAGEDSLLSQAEAGKFLKDIGHPYAFQDDDAMPRLSNVTGEDYLNIWVSKKWGFDPMIGSISRDDLKEYIAAHGQTPLEE